MVILSKTKKIGFFYINWAISDKKPGQKECTSRFEFKLCGVFFDKSQLPTYHPKLS